MAFQSAIRIAGEGQIHPGKMMKSLVEKARGMEVEIQHGWSVEAINRLPQGFLTEDKTGRYLVSEKVLVATNGFSRRLLPQLDLRPARNQVIITKPVPALALRGNFHARAGYVYFRNVGNRLLIGGFRDLDPEGESTSEAGFSQNIQQALEAFVNEHLLPPGTWTVEQRWSGILGVGSIKSPILEEIQPGLWCAVRLGGMGVALGAGLGAEAAEKLYG
ncbi:MAG: FAD-dependent oxidoreductase [Bacteroidia bacterium]